jgi:lipopolysaccharide export system protein LptA
MRSAVFSGIIVAAAAFVTAPAQQQQSCSLDVLTTPGTVSHMVKLPNGETRYDVTDGVEATCGSKWLKADSATYYQERGLLYLFGNVEYEDGAQTLEADQATYYRDADWVLCEGNVRLSDTSNGSTLTGPLLEYYPQSAARPMERIFAPQRPHLTYSAGAGGPDDLPFEVDATRLHIYGDSAVAGAGSVVAERGDLYSLSDSMDLDLRSGQVWLLGDPQIEAEDVELGGDSILLLMQGNEVREIEAWPNASARGSELVLDAPFLRLFVEEGGVNRTVASAGDPERTGVVDSAGREPWVSSLSRDYRLVADSIDIWQPAGQLERVIAVGRAEATTMSPMVSGVDLFENDWLEGDTITGYFVPPDSAGAGEAEVELTQLVASGNARALYHILSQPEEGETPGPPAVNYVIGRIVTLWLETGEVSQARVIGPSTGVYLEPVPVATNGDSAFVPDTILNPADTAVVPDTIPTPADTTRTIGR